MYIGYEAWFSISGDEVWDDGNISDNQVWKQIGSGLTLGSPSSFLICSSSVSPFFEEQSQFHLELEQSRSGRDRSRSSQVVWGDGLRTGTEEWNGGSHPR